jgi:hypothetical protein
MSENRFWPLAEKYTAPSFYTWNLAIAACSS